MGHVSARGLASTTTYGDVCGVDSDDRYTVARHDRRRTVVVSSASSGDEIASMRAGHHPVDAQENLK